MNSSSSFVILVISAVLMALSFEEKNPVWIIPLVYFIISLNSLIFGKIVLMKFAPLAISAEVASLLSIREKTPSMIREGLNHWSFLRKKRITKKQIHSFVSKWLWAFYVSACWYTVFALAVILHIYMMRKRKMMEKLPDFLG
jgi:hypothetical protein